MLQRIDTIVDYRQKLNQVLHNWQRYSIEMEKICDRVVTANSRSYFFDASNNGLEDPSQVRCDHIGKYGLLRLDFEAFL